MAPKKNEKQVKFRTTSQESGALTPRSFLKGRRPEQFSDSVVEESHSLDRSILEYHLETLTSRSQELLFEDFARKLAQKTICPNLMPHTGPSGGGDGKVDTETYPVSESLANTWYVGAGSEAANERWAFAFSAKKIWKPKLESDIEKISLTQRGYKKAYFVSNQFISARNRAAAEDKLTAKFNIEVRILDRNWILDKVFEGAHEELAIAELAMAVTSRKVVRVGPLDAERQQELSGLEGRITLAAQEGRFDTVYVEDCIDAAIAARELELPKPEVDGRFLRAENAAKKWGTNHQKIQAVYQKARTSYYWYEEFENLLGLYKACEDLVIGTGSAYDLELLSSTWFCLLTLSRLDGSGVTEVELAERTQVLLAEAERLSAEVERPSNALQARSTGLLVRLACSSDDCGEALSDLRKVVENCEGLIGFPACQLFDLVIDLGTRFGDSAEYHLLFETTLRLSAARDGELSTANMLLRRGSQYIENERPVDVIRVVGRALRLLTKHESRSQLVSALHTIGIAYQKIGLLWAARGSILTAASILSGDFHKYGKLSERLADCAQSLKWIELTLGRVAPSLDWHQLELLVRDVVARRENELPDLVDVNYNAVLGIMFLKLEPSELEYLTRFVDVLEGVELPVSAVALRYALGHDEDLPLVELGFEEDPAKGFCMWRDQPANSQLPSRADLGVNEYLSLESTIIGCVFQATVENHPACLALTESVLAALESLMSTSMAAAVAPLGPRLGINVRLDEALESGFEFERFDEDGLSVFNIKCAAIDPFKLPRDELSMIQERTHELIIQVFAYGFLIRNSEDHVRKLLGDESALERALNFTQSFIHIGNVLGHAPKLSIKDWIQDGATEYSLRRLERWDARLAVEVKAVNPREPLHMGTGPVPEELLDEAKMRHTDFKSGSVIRLPLWDDAKWWAVGFELAPDAPVVPRLALVFRNREAGARIFDVWKREYSDRAAEEIRVAIVRGIDKSRPNNYRVSIGANPEVALRDSKFFMLFSRMCEMAPQTSFNLDEFLRIFNKLKCFYLLPAYANENSRMPEFLHTHEIYMRSLAVRQAWEIGPHDLDLPALDNEDDPIVPPGVTNPPYVEALKMRRERERG